MRIPGRILTRTRFDVSGNDMDQWRVGGDGRLVGGLCGFDKKCPNGLCTRARDQRKIFLLAFKEIASLCLYRKLTDQDSSAADLNLYPCHHCFMEDSRFRKRWSLKHPPDPRQTRARRLQGGSCHVQRPTSQIGSFAREHSGGNSVFVENQRSQTSDAAPESG